MVLGFGSKSNHNEEEARGRERGNNFATGRGGVGNLRSPSRGRGADTAAAESARVSAVKNASVLHSGRGGAGNVRSPSRDPVDRARARDEERKEATLQGDVLKNASVVHAGRGGAGNVRSPSRDPLDRARARDEERKEHEAQESFVKAEMAGPHTSGRGGAGNFGNGAGNATASREQSLERGRAGAGAANGSREPSSERGRGGGGVGSILRSLSRSRSRQRAPTDEAGSGANGGANAGDTSTSSSVSGHHLLHGHHHNHGSAAPSATPGGHQLAQVNEYVGGEPNGSIKTNGSSSDAHGANGATATAGGD